MVSLERPGAAELVERINTLRRERRAVILAHNYQIPEVQDVADIVGDSLAMAREAAKVEADVIVLCGVRFMAETVKLINPDRPVLMPDPNAGCPMADMISPRELQKAKDRHPSPSTPVSARPTTGSWPSTSRPAAPNTPTPTCASTPNARATCGNWPTSSARPAR